MFILRSWSGQVRSLFERSRICSAVTSPGSPSKPPSAGATAFDTASSGVISSIVDLKRTAGGDWGCWSAWSAGESVGSRIMSEFSTDKVSKRVSNDELRGASHRGPTVCFLSLPFARTSSGSWRLVAMSVAHGPEAANSARDAPRAMEMTMTGAWNQKTLQKRDAQAKMTAAPTQKPGPPGSRCELVGLSFTLLRVIE